MRRTLIALACGVLCTIGITSRALSGAPTPQNLIVEVWVNGANTSIIAKLVKRDGAWWARPADLKDAGVNLTGGSLDPLVAISAIDGIAAQIDPVDQRLMIEARTDRLTLQRIDLGRPQTNAEPVSGTGLVSSYTVTGTVGDLSRPSQSSGVGAFLGETLFSPLGTVSTTGFTDISNTGSQFVRLDSTAEWDEPGLLRRWTGGDTVTGGLPWSRSVRFGGFQVASDFSLQPGLTTFPLPAFFGEAAVPSTVDVFVNSARVFEGDVAPGPFELHDLPVVTGDGQATVVVRNVLGQETSQTFSFYASESLLREGLSSYDLDVGFLRRFYGEERFAYGDPIAAGTYRYGLTPFFTVEAHAEGAQNVQLAGGGGSLALGSYGVIGGDAAVSNGPAGTGELFAASFAASQKPFGLFGSMTATTGNYADLASVSGTAQSRLTTQLGANAGLDRYGSVALSWMSVKDESSSAVQLLTASHMLSFLQGWNFSTTALRDCTGHTWAAELNLSIPIGPDLFVNASGQAGAGTNEITAQLTRPTNPDGGFGYTLGASAGDWSGASADATWIGDHGSLEGGVSSVDGQSAGRLSASGALVVMNGGLFTTRNPNGALALVEAGQPGVPIYMENREVAVSDSNGEALLTNLTANAPNRISVQPTDYSFSTVMGSTDQVAVPLRRSGVVVDLAPPPSHPALLTLEMENGLDPPVGAEVRLSGATAALPVGNNGQAFLPDIQRHVSGIVIFPEGSCRFEVDPPKTVSPDMIPHIGPVRCLAERTP